MCGSKLVLKSQKKTESQCVFWDEFLFRISITSSFLFFFVQNLNNFFDILQLEYYDASKIHPVKLHIICISDYIPPTYFQKNPGVFFLNQSPPIMAIVNLLYP